MVFLRNEFEFCTVTIFIKRTPKRSGNRMKMFIIAFEITQEFILVRSYIDLSKEHIQDSYLY